MGRLVRGTGAAGEEDWSAMSATDGGVQLGGSSRRRGDGGGRRARRRGSDGG